jgi:hypothetical protein
MQDWPSCLPHSRPEPLAEQPPEGAIFTAFASHPDQPVLLDGVDEPLDVRFDRKVGPPALALHGQPSNGVPRSHVRPVPIATPQDILLVDSLQYPRDGELPQLILDGGDASRAPLAVPCRDVPPSDELSAVALPLESLHEMVKVLLEMALIVRRTDAVPPRGCLLRRSRQPPVRNGSSSNASRVPDRWLGCAWAFFAIPCQKVDMGPPARLVRSMLPGQAPSSCQPLPQGHGPAVSECGGLICPPPRRRRPFLRSGWPTGPAGRDRRGSPKFLALLFPPTRLLVDPGGPAGPSPVAVPLCWPPGRSTHRRPLDPW